MSAHDGGGFTASASTPNMRCMKSVCVCQSPSSNVKHTSCEDTHLIPRYDMTKGLAQDAVAADVIQLQVVHLALPQRTAWPQDVGAPTRLWPCALTVEPLCTFANTSGGAGE